MTTNPTVPAPRSAASDSAEAAAARRALLAERLRERAQRPAPLAPHQERLAVLAELEPASSAYHVPVVLRLVGDLDVEALLQALTRLADRHAWLRSRVERRGDALLQVVDPEAGLELHRFDAADAGADADVDAHARTGGAGPAGLDAWVAGLVETPMDLAARPPWRAGVARVGPDEHLLVLVVHHVACDATSVDLLLDDLGAHYDAARAGGRAELPRPVPPQLVAERLRELAAGTSPGGAAAAVAARVDALAGTVPDARLPEDTTPEVVAARAARGAAAAGPAAADELALPPATARRLDAVTSALGVSPFAAVAACVAAVTARFTGLDSAVLGVPVDLRHHVPGGAGVVAFLVETAPVGLRDVLSLSLAQAAGSVRDTVLASLDRPVPFSEVVAGLRRAGVLPATGTPLHTYLTWLEEDADPRLGRTGPRVTAVDPPLGEAKFDLGWTGTRGPDGVALHLEYDAARLGAATARRLLEHVAHLLDAATRDPRTPLGDLPLLPPGEERRLRDWEGTAGPVPDRDLLTEVLAGLAAAPPAEPVLLATARATDEPVTAGVLRRRVDDLAAALVAGGVRPGDAVVVSGRRSAAAVVGVLAALRAGAAFVPVDPAAPAARAERVARGAGARAVVGEPAWARRLAGAVGAAAVGVDDDGVPRRAAAPPPAWPRRRPTDVAYVMSTSGSTGTPKGVVVPDGAVVARVGSYRSVLADRDVVLLAHSPLGFDASIWMLWALAVGGRLVVPTDAEAADPVALARLVREAGVTDAFFVPSLYEPVLQAAAPGALASLRRVFVGGEAFPPALGAAHAAAAPGAALLNVYGPTETVVTATAHRLTAAELTVGAGAGAGAGGAVVAPVPIGRPHPGTLAVVLDAAGRRVPVGAPGLLHVGGPALALGYAGRLDAADGPFHARAGDDRSHRWYATGDVVRWTDDGELVFLGRRDRQVKVRGQRVELAEVEAALRRCAGVTEAAVEAVGEAATRRLVAVVAPAARPDLDAQARALLPAAWVPTTVAGVPALPRLASGKLDRAALLAEVARAEAGRTGRSGTGRARLRPAGGGAGSGAPDPGSFTQKAVLGLARSLLGRDDVGLDDDFFAAGGDSLLAARLVGALHARLDVEVPLSLLAAGATPRRLADLVDDAVAGRLAQGHDGVRLLPLREEGRRAPVVVVARDGDSSLLLRHLLPALAPDRPVWVLLRPVPPLGPDLPDLREHGVAAARALLERFPAGPVHVLGHSASGVVALEAGRALGERRGAVVLLDTDCPDEPRRGVARLREAARVARLRLWLRRRRGVRLGRLTPEQRADPAVIRSVRYYHEALAMDRARPQPVPFPVALVTAEESRGGDAGGDLGWGRWCPALRLFPVGGDHHTMLMEPASAETAAALDEVLRELP